MSSRRNEFLVVCGVIVVFVLLVLREISPGGVASASKRMADNAVARGALLEAELAARGCVPDERMTLEPDARLSCIARLAELEFGSGKVRAARARLDSAISEADSLGAAVSNNTRSELGRVSSMVSKSEGELQRAVTDARSALAFATDLRHRAAANLRLVARHRGSELFTPPAQPAAGAAGTTPLISDGLSRQ
jgi:hypothetical protein